MLKSCEDCGKEFEAKRRTARFCSERCKKRAQRRPGGSGTSAAARRVEAAVSQRVPDAAPAPAEVRGELTESVRAALEAAGRLGDPSGQVALVLAGRIEDGTGETGSSLASMTRELRAAVADALKDAGGKSADPGEDELEKARARRRAIAGG